VRDHGAAKRGPSSASSCRARQATHKLPDRVIREAINEDVGEATEQVALKALPETARG
jgi:hypothetical protein